MGVWHFWMFGSSYAACRFIIVYVVGSCFWMITRGCHLYGMRKVYIRTCCMKPSIFTGYSLAGKDSVIWDETLQDVNQCTLFCEGSISFQSCLEQGCNFMYMFLLVKFICNLMQHAKSEVFTQ